MKRIICAVMALLMAAATSSCGAGSFDEFKYRDGKIVSEDEGREYFAAPLGFEPCGVGEKVAVRDGAFDLYLALDMEGNVLPEDDYLTEEYAGYASSVYYGADVSLPDYTEINFTKCFVTEENEIPITHAVIEDKKTIDEIIERVSSGTELLLLDEPDKVYYLKFYSPDFPALLYSLDCYVVGGGVTLYNRATKQTAPGAADLLGGYIEILQDE